MLGKGGRVSRNILKGHMDKTKGLVGLGVGGGGGWVGGSSGGKMGTIVLKKLKKEIISFNIILLNYRIIDCQSKP